MDLLLPNDFREFLSLLIDERVRFLLVGGYAVCYHAEPRVTGDIDFWIEKTPENIDKTVKALHRFGFVHGEVSPEMFDADGTIVRMGFPPMRIELMNRIDGVEFADCYDRRVTADVDGLPTPVISLADLKINKRAAGRPKDLADLATLELTATD